MDATTSTQNGKTKSYYFKYYFSLAGTVAAAVFSYFYFLKISDQFAPILLAFISIAVYTALVVVSAYAAHRKKTTMGILHSLISMCSVMAVIIIFYAIIFKITGLLDNGVVVHDADTSMYFSIVTWTTLGYGDVVPLKAERLLAASEAIVGYLTMTLLLAVLVSWFSKGRVTS